MLSPECRPFRLRAMAIGLTAGMALLAGPAAGAHAACTAPVKSTAYDNPADVDGAYITNSNSAWRMAQSFSLSSPITLTKVSLYLRSAVSETQSIVVEIRSDSGGNPGAVLATRSALFTNTNTAFDELDFSADGLSLAAGIPYYIVARSTGGYTWEYDSSSPTYTGGNVFTSSDSGASWTNDPAKDFLFQVFGQSCTPDPVQPGGRGGSAPALAAASNLALSRKAFAAEASGPSAYTTRRKPPQGTQVSYTLNAAASVRFTVRRRTKGRRVKRGRKTVCAKPTRGNRKKRRCTRLVTLKGSFSRNGVAGRNSFHFTGRLNGRKLSPGRYLLVATPSAGGTSGKPVSTGFRIVR